MTYRLTAAAMIAAVLLLSGCESSEERAEGHFQKALELLDQGETERAILEMRNALQLVSTHQQARQTLAETHLDGGRIELAVKSYRLLVEDHPENGEGHLALAEIALDLRDWEAVEKHGTKAQEILGDTPDVAAVLANLSYRDALEAETRAPRRAAVEAAAALVEAEPSLIYARMVVIDDSLRSEDWLAALDLIDGGLEHDPDRLDLYQTRLSVLRQLGRLDEVTGQLEVMVERFPDDETLPVSLVRWYVSQEQVDDAEAFLRARSEAAPDEVKRQIQLVQFVNEVRGADTASEELRRLAAADSENAAAYRAMDANLMFRNGRTEQAQTQMEAILDGFSEEDAGSALANDLRVDLARMKALSGDEDTARKLIDAVLDRDPSHVAALKMRATWQIEDDLVSEAVGNLRLALRDAPRDVQIMTLMAAAHERAGEAELQREMLALAVETSHAAPGESLRYASLLSADGHYRTAEGVLVSSLRQNPNELSVLAALGRTYMQLEDWARAEQVRDNLARLVEAGAGRRAMAELNVLQAQLLAKQKRDEELFDFLDELSGSGQDGVAANIAIIRAHAARGELDAARKRLDAALEENGDQPVLRYLSGALRAASGEFEAAEAEMRALLEVRPDAEPVWMALFRMKLVQGDREGASDVLDQALEALPNGVNLLFSRAGELEAAGNIDGAVNIYEKLYDADSSNEVVANNLASLLSTYRSDAETLERAYVVGRRLQDSRNPAMRDTYGWIAARMGRYEEAEPHLEFAAERLSDHPVVLYHYAVALNALGRNAEALDHFRLAEQQAGSVLPEADLETVRAEIARLETDLSGQAEEQATDP